MGAQGGHTYAALVFLLLFAAVRCQDEGDLSEGLRKDREGLMALKSRLSSFGTSQMEAWKSSGNPCGPIVWSHIKCKNDRVVELDLAGMNLVGELAVGLRKASRLEIIDLSQNTFTGTLHSDWGKKISFTRLRELRLSGNQLTGTLPNWNRGGAWRSLQTLELGQNQFWGGLPANWLGKTRPMRNVEVINLDDNNLGKDENGATLATWCPAEGSLKTGSGWCPVGSPIEGTAASLRTLGLANNGLIGTVPSKWPMMFPSLRYLHLQWNDLYLLDGSYRVPSLLPISWFKTSERGFPSLSVLTLYPGNEYLCSVPDDSLLLQDINPSRSFVVQGEDGQAYGDGNPAPCPALFSGDNPVTAVAFNSKTEATWTKALTPGYYIWGFRVTISALDAEAGIWGGVDPWNGKLLRTYTFGQDGFTTPAVTCNGSGVCTLPLSELTAAPSQVSRWSLDVKVVNLDGSESSVETAYIDNT